MPALEERAKRYQAESIRNCDEAARLHYNPLRWRQMIAEHGAVEATRRLLADPNPTSDGMTTLLLMGRLDLSAEALMLKPEYQLLFTADELTRAREILKDHAYVAPWDTTTAPARISADTDSSGGH